MKSRPLSVPGSTSAKINDADKEPATHPAPGITSVVSALATGTLKLAAGGACRVFRPVLKAAGVIAEQRPAKKNQALAEQMTMLGIEECYENFFEKLDNLDDPVGVLDCIFGDDIYLGLDGEPPQYFLKAFMKHFKSDCSVRIECFRIFCEKLFKTGPYIHRYDTHSSPFVFYKEWIKINVNLSAEDRIKLIEIIFKSCLDAESKMLNHEQFFCDFTGFLIYFSGPKGLKNLLNTLKNYDGIVGFNFKKFLLKKNSQFVFRLFEGLFESPDILEVLQILSQESNLFAGVESSLPPYGFTLIHEFFSSLLPKDNHQFFTTPGRALGFFDFVKQSGISFPDSVFWAMIRFCGNDKNLLTLLLAIKHAALSEKLNQELLHAIFKYCCSSRIQFPSSLLFLFQQGIPLPGKIAKDAYQDHPCEPMLFYSMVSPNPGVISTSIDRLPFSQYVVGFRSDQNVFSCADLVAYIFCGEIEKHYGKYITGEFKKPYCFEEKMLKEFVELKQLILRENEVNRFYLFKNGLIDLSNTFSSALGSSFSDKLAQCMQKDDFDANAPFDGFFCPPLWVALALEDVDSVNALLQPIETNGDYALKYPIELDTVFYGHSARDFLACSTNYYEECLLNSHNQTLPDQNQIQEWSQGIKRLKKISRAFDFVYFCQNGISLPSAI